MVKCMYMYTFGWAKDILHLTNTVYISKLVSANLKPL